MLASLLSANPPETVHVHLLHDASLPDRDLNSLTDLVRERGGAIDTVDVSGRVEALAWTARFPLSAWFRVLLPGLLPDLDRVLYIDADVLITARLEPLWNIDLYGNLIGAITNPLYPGMADQICADIGWTDVTGYFNSGVLLIDLTGWRRHGITDEVFRFALSRPHLNWPDQDSLNAVLSDRCRHLHPRWNAMPALWQLPRRLLPYSDREIEEAIADPAILHFIGPHKPRHFRFRHPYRQTYLWYLSQTPWRDSDQEGRTPWNALVKPLPVLWSYRVERQLELRTRRCKQLGRDAGELIRASLRTVIPPDATVYGWLRAVRRLLFQRGLDALVDVLDALSDTRPGAQLVIIGQANFDPIGDRPTLDRALSHLQVTRSESVDPWPAVIEHLTAAKEPAAALLVQGRGESAQLAELTQHGYSLLELDGAVLATHGDVSLRVRLALWRHRN